MADREYTAKDAQPIVNYGYKGASIYPLQIDDNGNLMVSGGLVPKDYDEIVLSYTGDDLTGVVYKLATVTVATLTLSYTGTNLTGVVWS